MRPLKKLNDNVSDDQPVQKTVNQDTIRRRRNNVQVVANVLLIWLDNNIDTANIDCQNTTNKLQRTVSSMRIFTNSEECIQFMKMVATENICVVISGALGEDIVPQFYHMPQVDRIFIFCAEKQYHEQWIKNWPKIRGVFTNIDLICDDLKQVALQSEENLLPISFLETTGDMTNKKLNQLEPSFMYTQLIKEILLTITFEERHFEEFISYCTEILDDNPIQLQHVNKIKRKYREKTPIWWYTYECFLYSTLNRALRTLDTDFIITVGFFIKDLHLQIEQMYKEQSDNLNSDDSFIVYRGQGMIQEEFDKMIQTKGSLLSFNCFLSTSKKREVSLGFAQRSTTNSKLVGILFVIAIDPSQSTTPFAAISKVSYFQNQEEEILFSMHTVFRITDITPIGENQRLFQVNLILTSDNDPDLRVLAARIREETSPNSQGWYRLGLTLLKMGHPKKAEEVYQILLEQATTEREIAHIYNQIGWGKDERGESEDAIIWYEKSLEIYKKILSPNDPDLACIYNNIALVYYSIGDYSKALSSYEKSLAIQQQSLLPNHPYLASIYNNISNVYYRMGEYTKALSYDGKALAIQQQVLPPNHPELAKSYITLGLVYAAMEEHLKSISFYEKALAIQQQSLPPNHPDLTKTYIALGAIYAAMEEYLKSISFYGQALAIQEQSLPPNHPDLAMSYNNIGNVHYSMGEYCKALSSYEKALAIRQQSLPPNHPDLTRFYDNIGLVYDKMSEYCKALSYYEKALAIQQQSLPVDHPDLAVSYNNIGLMYDKMSEYSKALSSHEKALVIQQQSLPPNHPDLASTYNNIGSVYYNRGEYSKAFSSYEKALAIRQESLPSNHPDLARSYITVGVIYAAMEEYSESISSYEKALAIQQQSLPPNHPDLAMSYNNIGNVHYSMGEYSKALSSHEKALAIRQESLPPNHSDLAMSYGHIGNVYSTIGEYSKALSFCQRAVDIAEQTLPSDHWHLQWYKNNLETVKTNCTL